MPHFYAEELATAFVHFLTDSVDKIVAKCYRGETSP
jgi:hypothetical protein